MTQYILNSGVRITDTLVNTFASSSPVNCNTNSSKNPVFYDNGITPSNGGIASYEISIDNSFTDDTCNTNHTSGLSDGSTNNVRHITMGSTSRLAVGMSVTGTGVPAGATIASINNATCFTLSADTTATNANQTFTFDADLSDASVNGVSNTKDEDEQLNVYAPYDATAGDTITLHFSNLSTTRENRIHCYRQENAANIGIKLGSGSTTIETGYEHNGNMDITTNDYFVLVHSDDAKKHHLAKITKLLSFDDSGDAFEFEPAMENEIEVNTKFRIFKGPLTTDTKTVAVAYGLIQDTSENRHLKYTEFSRPTTYFYNSRLDEKNVLNAGTKYQLNQSKEIGGTPTHSSLLFRTRRDFEREIVDTGPYNTQAQLIDVLYDSDRYNNNIMDGGGRGKVTSYTSSLTSSHSFMVNGERSSNGLYASGGAAASGNFNGPTRYLHYEISPTKTNIVNTVLDISVSKGYGSVGNLCKVQALDHKKILASKIQEQDTFKVYQDLFELEITKEKDTAIFGSFAGSSGGSTLTVTKLKDGQDLRALLRNGSTFESFKLGDYFYIPSAITAPSGGSQTITVGSYRAVNALGAYASGNLQANYTAATAYRRRWSSVCQNLIVDFEIDTDLTYTDLDVSHAVTTYKVNDTTTSKTRARIYNLEMVLRDAEYSGDRLLIDYGDRANGVVYFQNENKVLYSQFTGAGNYLDFFSGQCKIQRAVHEGEVEEIHTETQDRQPILTFLGMDKMAKLLGPVVNKNYLHSEDYIYSNQGPVMNLVECGSKLAPNVVINIGDKQFEFATGGGTATHYGWLFTSDNKFLGECAKQNLANLELKTGALTVMGSFIADTNSNTTIDSIAINATTELKVGMNISGSGIPSGTTITGITDANTITISQAATASAEITINVESGPVLYIKPYDNTSTESYPNNWFLGKALSSDVGAENTFSNLRGASGKGVVFTSGNSITMGIHGTSSANTAIGEDLVGTSYNNNSTSLKSLDTKTRGFYINDVSSIHKNETKYYCKLGDESGASFDGVNSYSPNSLSEYTIVSFNPNSDASTTIRVAPTFPVILGRVDQNPNETSNSVFADDSLTTIHAYCKGNRITGFLPSAMSDATLKRLLGPIYNTSGVYLGTGKRFFETHILDATADTSVVYYVIEMDRNIQDSMSGVTSIQVLGENNTDHLYLINTQGLPVGGIIAPIDSIKGSNISNAYKIPVPLTFFPYGGLYFKYTNLNRFKSGTLNRNPIKKINYIESSHNLNYSNTSSKVKGVAQLVKFYPGNRGGITIEESLTKELRTDYTKNYVHNSLMIKNLYPAPYERGTFGILGSNFGDYEKFYAETNTATTGSNSLLQDDDLMAPIYMIPKAGIPGSNTFSVGSFHYDETSGDASPHLPRHGYNSILEIRDMLQVSDPKSPTYFLFSISDILPESMRRDNHIGFLSDSVFTDYSLILKSHSPEKVGELKQDKYLGTIPRDEYLDTSQQTLDINSASITPNQIKRFGLMRLIEATYDFTFNPIDGENPPTVKESLYNSDIKHYYLNQPIDLPDNIDGTNLNNFQITAYTNSVSGTRMGYLTLDADPEASGSIDGHYLFTRFGELIGKANNYVTTHPISGASGHFIELHEGGASGTFHATSYIGPVYMASLASSGGSRVSTKLITRNTNALKNPQSPVYPDLDAATSSTDTATLALSLFGDNGDPSKINDFSWLNSDDKYKELDAVSNKFSPLLHQYVELSGNSHVGSTTTQRWIASPYNNYYFHGKTGFRNYNHIGVAALSKPYSIYEEIRRLQEPSLIRKGLISHSFQHPDFSTRASTTNGLPMIPTRPYDGTIQLILEDLGTNQSIYRNLSNNFFTLMQGSTLPITNMSKIVATVTGAQNDYITGIEGQAYPNLSANAQDLTHTMIRITGNDFIFLPRQNGYSGSDYIPLIDGMKINFLYPISTGAGTDNSQVWHSITGIKTCDATPTQSTRSASGGTIPQYGKMARITTTSSAMGSAITSITAGGTGYVTNDVVALILESDFTGSGGRTNNAKFNAVYRVTASGGAITRLDPINNAIYSGVSNFATDGGTGYSGSSLTYVACPVFVLSLDTSVTDNDLPAVNPTPNMLSGSVMPCYSFYYYNPKSGNRFREGTDFNTFASNKFPYYPLRMSNISMLDMGFFSTEFSTLTTPLTLGKYNDSYSATTANDSTITQKSYTAINKIKFNFLYDYISKNYSTGNITDVEWKNSPDGKKLVRIEIDTFDTSDPPQAAGNGFLNFVDLTGMYLVSEAGSYSGESKSSEALFDKNLSGTTSDSLTGSIDPAASTSVTGVGTQFLTELSVGDSITVSGETRIITGITSDTALTVDVAFSNNANDTTVAKISTKETISQNIGTDVSSNFFRNVEGITPDKIYYVVSHETQVKSQAEEPTGSGTQGRDNIIRHIIYIDGAYDSSLTDDVNIPKNTHFRIMKPAEICTYNFTPNNIETYVMSRKTSKKPYSNEMYGQINNSFNSNNTNNSIDSPFNEGLLSMYVTLDVDTDNSDYVVCRDKGNLFGSGKPFTNNTQYNVLKTDGEIRVEDTMLVKASTNSTELSFTNMQEAAGILSIGEIFEITTKDRITLSDIKSASIGVGVTVAPEIEDIVNNILKKEEIDYTKRSDITSVTETPKSYFMAPEFLGGESNLFSACSSILGNKDLELYVDNNTIEVSSSKDFERNTSIEIDEMNKDTQNIMLASKNKNTFELYNDVVVYGKDLKVRKRDLESIKLKGKRTLERIDRTISDKVQAEQLAQKLLRLHSSENIELKIETDRRGTELVKIADSVVVHYPSENIPRSNYMITGIDYSIDGVVKLTLSKYSKGLGQLLAENITEIKRLDRTFKEDIAETLNQDIDLFDELEIGEVTLQVHKITTSADMNYTGVAATVSSGDKISTTIDISSTFLAGANLYTNAGTNLGVIESVSSTQITLVTPLSVTLTKGDLLYCPADASTNLGFSSGALLGFSTTLGFTLSGGTATLSNKTLMLDLDLTKGKAFE